LRVISRLPGWVWIGAGLLACVAGSVNAVALLGLDHEAVSHVTGTAARWGLGAAGALPAPLGHLTLLVVSFAAGAVLSGVLIPSSTLVFGRIYGVALLIEASLLALAVPLLQRGAFSGELLAAAACGLQNAMATTYSGAVVRTTHVTGVVTDLGLSLGHALRGGGFDVRRVTLHSTILSGFVAGAALGGLAWGRWGHAALWAPAAACALAGTAYMAVRTLARAAD
jgi:uncharacterized membrane protein YoaK (UPF0700 family)